jgi:hypothetical protein
VLVAGGLGDCGARSSLHRLVSRGWLKVWDVDEDVDLDLDLVCTGCRPDDDVQYFPRTIHVPYSTLPARRAG